MGADEPGPRTAQRRATRPETARVVAGFLLLLAALLLASFVATLARASVS